MKLLPQAEFESAEDAFVSKPKARSRRFPCKVMYMGVVCPPIRDANDQVLFDGKVMLKRVSTQVHQKQQSYNQRFVPRYEINHKLKEGEWQSLYVENMKISEFLFAIQNFYHIDEETASSLVFTYNSLSVSKKDGKLSHKFMKLSPMVKDGPVLEGRRIRYKKKNGTMGERALQVTDLTLKVNPQKGKILEKDISCDSQFMLNHIREIGSSIRRAYDFLEPNVPVYLFIDNAGGHGKIEVKKQYEQILHEEFNINIEWQIPNSPETNMLDLGVWVSLQSIVENIHKGKVMQSDVLAQSVEEAFGLITSTVLDKVHSRWKLVLQLLVSGRGTNKVVEEHRGLQKGAMLKDLPGVPECKAARGYVSSEGEESESDEDSEDYNGNGLNVEKEFDRT